MVPGRRCGWDRSRVAAALVTAWLGLSAVLLVTSADARGPRLSGTPEEVFKAFMDALRAGERPAMIKMLGPDARDIVSSGDDVADRQIWRRFVEKYDQAHRLEAGGERSSSSSGPTTSRCRSRSCRTARAGASTPRRDGRRSSAAASVRTSWPRSRFAWPMWMPSASTTGSGPAAQVSSSMRSAWSARQASATASSGRPGQASRRAPWERSWRARGRKGIVGRRPMGPPPTTAISTACSPPRARMRRGAPTTTWSAAT